MCPKRGNKKEEESPHDCAVESWLPYSKEIGKVALLPATLPDSPLNLNIQRRVAKMNGIKLWVQREHLKSSR